MPAPYPIPYETLTHPPLFSIHGLTTAAMDLLLAVPVFAVSWLACLALHEGMHLAVAMSLGFGFHSLQLRVHLFRSAAASVHVHGIDSHDARVVRHAGWMASVAIAAILTWKWRQELLTDSWVSPALAGCWCVAAEAISSDLLALVGAPLSTITTRAKVKTTIFCCGNFGVLVLRALSKPHVLPVLRRMMQTTMLRGAQSAGIVSFAKRRWRAHVYVAKRVRVVNGKRTDLCDLLLPSRFSIGSVPTLYSGHTRFATSSRASMEGCHPHSWSPAIWQTEWVYSHAKGTYEARHSNVEAFVTHNGDLDFIELNGREYTLSEVQQLLPRVLHQPLPSTTDSACLAGLFELLRTRGLWLPSVRHGLLLGGLDVAGALAEEEARLHQTQRAGLGGGGGEGGGGGGGGGGHHSGGGHAAAMRDPSAFWELRTVQQVAALFEGVWKKVCKEQSPSSFKSSSGGSFGGSFGASVSSRRHHHKSRRPSLSLRSAAAVGHDVLRGQLPANRSFDDSLDDSKHSDDSKLSSCTFESSHSAAAASLAQVRWGTGSVRGSVRKTRLTRVEHARRRGGSVCQTEPLSEAERAGRAQQERATRQEEQAAEVEGSLCAILHDRMVDALLEGHLPALHQLLGLADLAHARTGSGRLSTQEEDACLKHFVRVSVSSFLYNDLLYAGKELLRRTKGSFGIVLSHTLDCSNAFLIGARGQTMSIGFYPHLGMVLFGSESAATKAAMGIRANKDDDLDASKTGGSSAGASFDLRTNELKSSFRLELDDLGGEVVLVTWANASQRASRHAGSSACSGAGGDGSGAGGDGSGAGNDAPPTCGYLERRYRRQDSNRAKCEATSHVIDEGGMRCDVLSLKEVRHAVHQPFFQRVTRLDGNPLIEPLVPLTADPVGQDLREIPFVLQRYQRPRKGLAKQAKRRCPRPPCCHDLCLLACSLAALSPLPCLLLPLTTVALAFLALLLSSPLLSSPLRLKQDFEDKGSSLNLKPAWTFSLRLRRRLMLRETAKVVKSIDLLITGCEISLWAGEQFASDLHLAFPSLKIVTLSANKLLGMLGQKFVIPQEGFQFNGETYSFRDSIVLLISQSGGTFATLAVANLLRAVTSDLFSISSEWDTQVARSVRGRPKRDSGEVGARLTNLFHSYTFSTFAGLRPAEPCTLSLVATHALLTHLLIFSMNYNANTRLGGSTFEAQEVQELNGFHESHMEAVRAIVGVGSNLHDSKAPSDASRMLKAQGRRWAQHVLEGPIAWILSAGYIAITVIAGAAPMSSLYAAASVGLGLSPDASSSSSSSSSSVPSACGASLANASMAAAAATAASNATVASSTLRVPPHVGAAVGYVAAALDAVLYVFLPIWMTWLLRLIQGRPMLHRVAGRSLLIGDIPFVAQSIEAYVSKLFALSYSIASVSVASANPTDHLVHRHTHRVVRGSLLAVGRPDARLNALTTADNATCLAINQACAITNLGSGCEAITIGHHANKPDMVDTCLVLPATRPKFISELAMHDDVHLEGPLHAQNGGQIRRDRGLRDRLKRQAGTPPGTPSSTPNSSQHGPATSNSSQHGPAASNSSQHGPASSRGGDVKWDRSMTSDTQSRPSGSSPALRPPAVDRSNRRESVAISLSKSFVKRAASVSQASSSLFTTGDEQLESSASPMAMLGQMAALRKCAEADQGATPSKVHARLQTLAPADDSFHQRMKAEFSRMRARMTVPKLREPFVGAWMQHSRAMEHLSVAQIVDRQRNLQQLYETRFAALQRMVAFMVLFHAMGKAVQDFWPRVSCGLLGYDMSRSQSMLRVASTAAPVSGSEVRDRILELEREEMEQWAARCIQRAVRWTSVLRKRLASNASRMIFEQGVVGGEQSTETMLAAELVAALPEHYLISTTIDERQLHLELYMKYKQELQSGSSVSTAASANHPHDQPVLVAWRRRETRVLLCLAFLDCVGSLSSIMAVLSSRGIDIKRVAAFSTKHGIAIDSFEVDLGFNEAMAELLRARVSQLMRDAAAKSSGAGSMPDLARLLPDAYTQSTTLDDQRIHFELYQLYEEQVLSNAAAAGGDDGGDNGGGGGGGGDAAALEGRVQMSWSLGRTEATLYIVHKDMLGSLGLITNVLREFGVNIQSLAAFCTTNGVAIDKISATPNFSGEAGRALKARLLSELAIRTLASEDETAKLIASMPEHYLFSTTPDERTVHLELYKQLEQSSSKEDVQLSWRDASGSSSGAAVILHLTFFDTTGSLAVITTALLEAGVGILRAGIYCTYHGVAIDTFELSSFSGATADLLVARLSAHISSKHGWMQSLARTLTGQSSGPSSKSSTSAPPDLHRLSHTSCPPPSFASQRSRIPSTSRSRQHSLDRRDRGLHSLDRPIEEDGPEPAGLPAPSAAAVPTSSSVLARASQMGNLDC